MTRESMKVPLLLILSLLVSTSWGFVIPQQKQSPLVSVNLRSSTLLHAKKGKKKKGRGKGFGQPVESTSVKKTSPPVTEESTLLSDVAATSSDDSSPFLQSVESGGSSAIPQIDSSLPPEERTKQILREKYGMRTLGEQRMEDNIVAQRQKLEEWKQLADKGEDFDLFAMIPAPVLRGIDIFLKVGVGISITAFVLAGIAITAEAWSKATGNELPGDMNTFIADVIEPNFTYGLFVVLGFSVSLGAFAAAQLSSSSATYKEDGS